MKIIIIVSLVLNLATMYQFFRYNTLTDEYAILVHSPLTILLVIYLLYSIAKGEKN